MTSNDFLNKTIAPKGATAVLLILGDEPICLFGRGLGSEVISVGELCFNTSMSGYQEILTDPSYASQVINFTFPHIGNVGSNLEDMEAVRAYAVGAVFRNDITQESNFRAEGGLGKFLVDLGLPAICGVDTRGLTHRIRDGGAPTVVLQYDEGGKFDLEALWDRGIQWGSLVGKDLAIEVTCREPYEWRDGLWQLGVGSKASSGGRHRIVAIDYGVKHNILRHLVSCGCDVVVVPADYSSDKILALEPDGVFLSNGPGDPEATGVYAVPILRDLLAVGLPIFGICLGHQLLCLACGGRTEKMGIGHRGANHPVHDLGRGCVEITSQNHGFCVSDDGLDGVEVTHRSLFDGSVEGVVVSDLVFSVQYHPEASPGPHDSGYLFGRFVGNVERYKHARG